MGYLLEEGQKVQARQHVTYFVGGKGMEAGEVVVTVCQAHPEDSESNWHTAQRGSTYHSAP
eukprot:scaffold216074_cov19-Tisochrysis_lutea.AAC.1